MSNCSKSWIKESFNYHGKYLTYKFGGEDKFVGRFKYGGMGHFKTFLKKNFTPEEYFKMYDEGFTPVGILETKGYVSKNLQEFAKHYGFEPTQRGVQQALKYVRDEKDRKEDAQFLGVEVEALA